MKKCLSLNILLTFILFVWGSIVRSSGAGLACPDWPLCQGQIIPPLQYLVILEWGHRLIASSVGFLTLGIGIWVLSSQVYRKKIGSIAGLAIVLLIVQILLGALTVKHLLRPTFVVIHMGVGLLFFSMLLWMWLKERNAHYILPKRTSGWVTWGFVGVVFFIYAQIILGASVSSSHAGLACPDFPTCLGWWIPPLSGLVALHFFHRISAYLILISVSLLAIWIQKKMKVLQRDIQILGILIVGQILLGVGNVIFKIPVAMSVAHLALATALYAVAFVIAYRLRHARLS